MKVRLQIIPASGVSFTFEHGGPVVRLGRDPAGELALEGEASLSVSWQHARLDLAPRGATVSDLKSTNGTLVNGVAIQEPTRLREGDEIRLGYTGPVLKILDLELAPPALPVAPASRTAAPRPAGASRALSIPNLLAQRPWLLPTAAAATCLLVFILALAWRSVRGGPNRTEGENPVPVSTTNPPTEASKASAVAAAPPPAETDKSAAPVRSPAGEGSAPVRAEPPEALAGALPAAKHQRVGSYLVLQKEQTESAGASVLLQRQRNPDLLGYVRPQTPIDSDYYLISLPGYRSRLRLESGVLLTLWGNVPVFSDFPPVWESTVMLHAPPRGVDLDFTLDHGRVHVRNARLAGPARVHVRFHQEIWELTLPEGASEAVVELWGFYPPDVPFSKESGGKGPLTCASLYTKGPARLKVLESHRPSAQREYDLPNATRFSWTNEGPPPAATALPALPAWWTEPPDLKRPEVAATVLGLQDWAEKLAKADNLLEAVLTPVRESDDALERSLGVYFLGALDAVPQLVDALEERQYFEVRWAARQVLQHWMGRSPDNDLELYRVLQQKAYSQENAEAILNLLHPVSVEKAGAKPETYERLLAYLDHKRLAVRELAWWQLLTLAPSVAKEIRYNAAAEPEERQKAVEQWRRRIPPGTVP